MKILLESFKIPRQLLSFISYDKLKDQFEEYDLSNIECEQVSNITEIKKAIEEGNIVFLIGNDGYEISRGFWDKVRLERNDSGFNWLCKYFIDGYIFFTKDRSKKELVAQRKNNKEFERLPTKQYKSTSFENDGYRSVYDDSLRKSKIIDKSGYEIDFDKYIKKLNGIKRISGSFERILIRIQNEYINLLNELYAYEIKTRKLALVDRDYADRISSYYFRDLKSEIVGKLDLIVRYYRDYSAYKQNFIRAEQKYQKHPDNLEAKDEYLETKKYIDKNEKELKDYIKDLENTLNEYKEKWSKLNNDSNVEFEESVKKSTFSKIFEAVKEPKLLLEYNDYLVYGKPFTKASIKNLSHIEDNWQIPNSFNQYTYMIVHKTEVGYLFVGEESTYRDKGYEDRGSSFYNHYGELADILYELYKNEDFNKFLSLPFINDNRRYIDFSKYIDTKEKALDFMLAGYVSSIEESFSKKFNFTDEEIANVVRYCRNPQQLLQVINSFHLINANVICKLQVINQNSNLYILFTSVLSEEQKKKYIPLIDVNQNKELLEYLFNNINICDYITEKQIISLFRQKIKCEDKGRENIRDILTSKSYNLPKDVTDKMLKIANRYINDINGNDEVLSNMKNIDANKVYNLLISKPEVVKQALADGMKIPDYMIEPIRRSLKAWGSRSILTKFNSVYPK